MMSGSRCRRRSQQEEEEGQGGDGRRQIKSSRCPLSPLIIQFASQFLSKLFVCQKPRKKGVEDLYFRLDGRDPVNCQLMSKAKKTFENLFNSSISSFLRERERRKGEDVPFRK